MKITEAILGQMTVPVLVLHEYSHAIFANPAFYDAFGVAAETLSGRSPKSVLETESQTSLLRSILETVLYSNGNIEGVIVEHLENKLVYSMNTRRLNFERLPTDMILVELFNITREHERETRIQELNATLLERKAELERINQDLESFVHSASHDLRTPLRLVNQVAHLLVQRYEDSLPSEALKMIDSIKDSTTEIGTLLEKLLAFSRINHSAVRRRPVDLSRLTMKVGEELALMGLVHLSEITVEEIPLVDADPTLLKQVMVNLVSNAAKFTRQRATPKIHVGSIEGPSETRYFVRDNGVGFDMEEVASLFTPFRRLKTAKDYDGSGLGLALVRRIVEYHGGRVWAEGKCGHGATIYFTLGSAG